MQPIRILIANNDNRLLSGLVTALRPWTIDFHVAQNDATVHGSGSHDNTGRHCLATDADGELHIPRDAGTGSVTRMAIPTRP